MKVSVCHINITSIVKHKDELLDKFSTYDIISVNETNLKRERPFSLKGYNIYRNDRVGKSGGGVLLAVKDHIKCSEILNESIGDNEIVAIEIHTNVDTHPTIGSSSGHKPLTFEVSIGAKHKSTSPRTSFNFKAANWTTFRKTLNDQLQLWNLSRTISTTVKIEEYNMFITNSLLEATHAAIPKLKQATSSYTISEATRNLINLKHHHYGK
ncbi:unnamed protein product [Rotaria magnacalcarata]|uniref:Endonuclease/exonuclease/phosphatase domain-containing protein n=1 Tax=Rotaria magnacalcarata TaxID=392030 RepID=A0A816RVI1_9BILA|nr:unnamed protein product [Rotaria magnacalcarata]